MGDLETAARRALACLDLTDLNDDCTAEDIEALCARARTPHGPVAAICIWPRFVAQAARLLKGSGIRLATVVNFPEGDHPAGEVIAMTEAAVADGAEEIDMVIPWRSLVEGHPSTVSAAIARVKGAAGALPVKAIIESGMLAEDDLIRQAAGLAIEAGAAFVKTSTGKVPKNATPQAARAILETIRDSGTAVGCKVSGGVRSTQDAAGYLALADEIMGPDWAGPETFRFGASGLLDALLATLDGAAPVASGSGY